MVAFRSNKAFYLLLFLLFLSLPALAFAARGDRMQPYVSWLPPDMSQGKVYPLVVFSHGYGGCARQSTFLTKALAAHGYIVVAPNHADARCDLGVRRILGFRRPDVPFREPQNWKPSTYANRRDDVVNAVDAVLADAKIGPHVDRDRMALSGHSLGGYTSLGLSGAWPEWRDKRFKAVLALSPFADPYIVQKTLRNIGVPVMYQGGTEDNGVTPSLKQEGGGGYAQTPAPKFFVNFNGAGHFDFSNRGGKFHDVIVEYSLAFLDHYLKGTEEPLLSAHPGPQVFEYRKDF